MEATTDPQETWENPIPAVDIVISFGEDLILIEREDGTIAFPGGFVDKGESFETAARREAKEETNLDVLLVQDERDRPVHQTYSDPGRDPRDHITTTAYYAIGVYEEGNSYPEAGDDAASVHRLPIDEALAIDEDRWWADHRRILRDYVEWKRS